MSDKNSNSGKPFLNFLSKVDDVIDQRKFAFKKRFNLIDPVVIQPYRGFGNLEQVKISGRILEDEGINVPVRDDSKWRNLVSMYKRFNSDEIPFARLKATFQGQEQTATADDEGYFHLEFNVNQANLDQNMLWHPVQLELLDQIVPSQEEVETVGEVLIPDKKTDFGVISDVDDTILVSEVNQLFRVLKLSLTENAMTRSPFEGATGFYRALAKGQHGNYHNPFFYVSSSPWNLYDVLKDFFKINNIPKGPILLRDIGIDPAKFIKESHHEHKPVKIRSVLDTYPQLNFILIGDSGQHDPEIYHQVVKEYPNRILAIYIRDVTPESRDAEIDTIQQDLTSLGVEMLRCADTATAARHAIEKGFIKASALTDVQQEKEKDQEQQ
ncbi:MAG: phosphatase domain-containing protein [Tunicatimonas sp.]|uniref:App1 family protein n=1 Tax=Tunicatimonas sp. TaxID=1940096 RepID=UPI003C72229B